MSAYDLLTPQEKAHQRRLWDLEGRLRWQYGAERARAIMESRDLKENADRAAWARCGGATILKPGPSLDLANPQENRLD